MLEVSTLTVAVGGVVSIKSGTVKAISVLFCAGALSVAVMVTGPFSVIVRTLPLSSPPVAAMVKPEASLALIVRL